MDTKLTSDQFAEKIKVQYPAYKNVDNQVLANKMIEKYPEYKDKVSFSPSQLLLEKKTSVLDGFLNVATKVNNFLGGKAVAETYGAEIAKANIPGATALGIPKQTEEGKALITQPTLKETVGSALQLGANLIPGAGVGASTAAKVATGAAIGYANDLGSDLQAGNDVKDAIKPGVGTVIGGALPILGKLIGLSNVSNSAKNVSNKLEEINLRLSPVEKQNLEKNGKGIVDYLAAKKIVGSPVQRFQKVDKLYNEVEDKVAKVVDNSNLKIKKDTAIEAMLRIPEKYRDNLTEYDSVVSKVDRMVKTLKSNFGDTLTAKQMNIIKRNEWKNAYNKANTEVINDVSNEVGHIFKAILDDNVSGLEKINDEYGKLITARRALFKATSRNQAGLLGKAAGLVAGTTLGGAIAGPGGAAVGSFVGPQVTNSVATPVRSATGAASRKIAELVNKIPTDSRGKLLIGRKALLDLIGQSNEN